ncbi:transducin/WD40 repeat-like superfamily protein isoform X2 [Wolffia australiana]
MDSHIQTTPLIECPSYPDSVAWSEENLVAVASGSVVTILNPALASGPRGLIKLPPGRIHSIGVVKEEGVSLLCVLLMGLLNFTVRHTVNTVLSGWRSNTLSLPSNECFVGDPSPCPCHSRSSLLPQVVDISKIFFDYLVSTNFDEIRQSKSNFDEVPASQTSGVEGGEDIYSPNSFRVKAGKGENLGAASLKKRKSFKSQNERRLPVITAELYESRNAMLSSLVVSWSSVLGSFPRSCTHFNYTILAVGGKSGKISLWRFRQPEYYTIEDRSVSVDAKLVGILQAHEEWVSSLGWGLVALDPSKPQLLLGTGSSDGSVRLWMIDVEELLTLSEVKFISIQLLREVISVTQIPISTLSMAVTLAYPDLLVLAVGKGSGSLEAWVCHLSSRKFERVGVYDAHDQLVTGLACAFDGCRLYSCSQDGNIYSWDLCIEVQKESHSYSVKVDEPRKLADLSDPCFGLVLAPGNLVIAVVRSFDVDLLNPMYQARTQKSAVEFLWALDPPPLSYHSDSQTIVDWRSKIFESLNYFMNPERPLVLSDIISALIFLWQNVPCLMENLLLDWLSSNFISEVPMPSLSFENIPIHIQSHFDEINIRKIHILNIVCRRLILPEMYKEEPPKNGNFQDMIGEKSLWHKLLVYSENIVRVRLVGFSLEAALFGSSESTEASSSVEVWSPVGLAQMRKWMVVNRNLVNDHLSMLLSKIDGSSGRDNSFEHDELETCGFCLSFVPFHSPDSASCRPANASATSHKLTRCAVSMKLSSLTQPQWYCICCKRWASHLLPESFFNTTAHQSSAFLGLPKALCPFCGILLQRYVPNFLLSKLPV